MHEEKIEKIFKWIDFVRVLLYVIVASAVAVAVWCTKIQMQTNENKLDIELSQANIQHHRDVDNEKEIMEEHRLTALEEAVSWLKHDLSSVRK